MDIVDFVIFGGGEHGRVVVDCLMSAGQRVRAIIDPRSHGDIFGVPVLKDYSPDIGRGARVIVALGDNKLRKDLVGKNKLDFGTAVHPSSMVSTHAEFGEGTMILSGAIVQTGTRIGRHAILNTGCQVDHGCQLGDFVHIGPGATLCGKVSIEEGVFVGAGSTIIPGLTIGRWAMVGAGAVVIADVPANTVVAGNPARVINARKK